MKGIKPTVVHFNNKDTSIERESPYLCGQPYVKIAEKYLTDDYFRTLPKCQDCLKKIRKVLIAGENTVDVVHTEPPRFSLQGKTLFDFDSNTSQSPPPMVVEEDTQVKPNSLKWWANKRK